MPTIEQAVAQLKKDPSHPVQAEVDGITVELRAIARAEAGKSAAQLFAELGPWEGETTEEMFEFFRDARRQGGQRNVPEL